MARMAQISSAYPTAGGLYHWGSILGNRFTGWLTAWFNLLGLVTVLGAINVGTYYFFMNRADYLDPALCWTGVKETGRGGSLSVLGFHNLTRPKSYHLRKQF